MTAPPPGTKAPNLRAPQSHATDFPAHPADEELGDKLGFSVSAVREHRANMRGPLHQANKAS